MKHIWAKCSLGFSLCPVVFFMRSDFFSLTYDTPHHMWLRFTVKIINYRSMIDLWYHICLWDCFFLFSQSVWNPWQPNYIFLSNSFISSTPCFFFITIWMKIIYILKMLQPLPNGSIIWFLFNIAFPFLFLSWTFKMTIEQKRFKEKNI